MSDDVLFSIRSFIPSPHMESVTYSRAVTFIPSSSTSTCSSIVMAGEAVSVVLAFPDSSLPLSWSVIPSDSSVLSSCTDSVTEAESAISFLPETLSAPLPNPITAPPTSHSDATPIQIHEQTCFLSSSLLFAKSTMARIIPTIAVQPRAPSISAMILSLE